MFSHDPQLYLARSGCTKLNLLYFLNLSALIYRQHHDMNRQLYHLAPNSRLGVKNHQSASCLGSNLVMSCSDLYIVLNPSWRRAEQTKHFDENIVSAQLKNYRRNSLQYLIWLRIHGAVYAHCICNQWTPHVYHIQPGLIYHQINVDKTSLIPDISDYVIIRNVNIRLTFYELPGSKVKSGIQLISSFMACCLIIL